MPTIPLNDAEFEAWPGAHPDGFVVNCNRNPTARYLRLHRATCPTIRSDQRQNYVGRHYSKICADRVSESPGMGGR